MSDPLLPIGRRTLPSPSKGDADQAPSPPLEEPVAPRSPAFSTDEFVGSQARAVKSSSQGLSSLEPVGESRSSRPGRTYDVGTIGAQELEALKAGGPKERVLAATIERARGAYADTLARGGRVLAGTSAGNGGQPVLTVIPPSFDRGQPATVQTHYHGFSTTAADRTGKGAAQTERIEALQRQDTQRVFVIPECANAPGRAEASVADLKTDWSSVRSQAQTTSDALDAAGITNVKERVVSAHSGGGAALASALSNVPGGGGLRADRLELLDSLYGSEDAVARWAGTPNGRDCQHVLYSHATNTRSDQALKSAFGDRFQRVEAPSHWGSLSTHLGFSPAGR